MARLGSARRLSQIWKYTSQEGNKSTMAKHIFVTGGVVSSLGKGLTSASIGMLLERRGLSVRMQKLDPYINVDPGTMSPYQHGEVYVLDDGSETDLDASGSHGVRSCRMHRRLPAPPRAAPTPRKHPKTRPDP